MALEMLTHRLREDGPPMTREQLRERVRCAANRAASCRMSEAGAGYPSNVGEQGGHDMKALIIAASILAIGATAANAKDGDWSKDKFPYAKLGDSDPPLSASIAKFQADEREHRDAAIGAGAETALGYPLLYAAIRAGCRTAIELSKRI